MAFRRKIITLAALAAALAAAMALSLGLGDYPMSLSDLWGLIWAKISGAPADPALKVREIIFFRVRLPRVLLAAGAGISLGAAGCAYQACFRNPLVEPYILGVSSGAAAGAALAIVFPRLFPQGQLAAFALALLAVFASWRLAAVRGGAPGAALVLSGIIVGSLFSALVGVMKYLAYDSQLREITFWMMGGLYFASPGDALSTLGAGALVAAGLGLQGWKLNLLTLGDEEAASLGVNPRRLRAATAAAATLAAALCVSACGTIAWVGLMTPHAARLLFGPDHRVLAPASGLLGALYLVVCDTIARTLTASEIPLGIVTSVIGAPYLVWLLRSRGRVIYGG
jgi:iron complex transport system permease protein